MKGERDRLGRARRRLADGVRLPCPSTFAESVPHNAKVWGTHHPGSFSGRPGLDRVSEESAWRPGFRAARPLGFILCSAFSLLPSLTPPSDRAQLRQERNLCRNQNQKSSSSVAGGMFIDPHSASDKGGEGGGKRSERSPSCRKLRRRTRRATNQDSHEQRQLARPNVT